MKVLLTLLIILGGSTLNAQIIHRDTSDLTFTGTKMNPYKQEYDSTGKLTFSGYIDAYYSYYADSVGTGGYCKFPTSSPRNNQFGLNLAQFGMRYESQRFHATGTVFFGDMPESAWSPKMNFIQEANAGFRVIKKLWFDAGFFRTHIGLESIQPRENITTSFALTTYFEPYYMSGAKLTWQQSEKLAFQLNAFNGFNTFVETNNTKSYGASISYTPSEKWSHTINTIVTDESPSSYPQSQWRSYTNYIGVMKSNRVTLGIEGNFGVQQNTSLVDSTATATMCSGIFATKYRFTSTFAGYGRMEGFYDPNEMLTGPVENSDHALVGLEVVGLTLGLEYKPIPNSYLRLESRYLHTRADEKIFFYNNRSLNYRWEAMLNLGVWF